MKKNVEIPLAILQNPIDQNRFTVLRFFYEFFGPENSRVIIALLAQEPTKKSIKKINKIFLTVLKKHFTKLRNHNKDQIYSEIIELYDRADLLISNLVKIAFPGMEFEMELLDNTITSNIDFAERLFILSSKSEGTQRLKYELIRQDILALLLLQINNYNHVVDSRQKHNEFQKLFESQLYSGKPGTIHKRYIYSIHESQTNRCIATFASLLSAQKYLAKHPEVAKNAHIKKFNSQMRLVKNIGYVLAQARNKSDLSTIRKILFYSKLDTSSKRKKISLEKQGGLEDTIGYMFVTPNKKRKKFLNAVITSILKKYPNAKIDHRDGVSTGRGQSRKVKYLRIFVRLESLPKPIEIIVISQIDYMNYLYELDQAHALYELKKTAGSSDILFPTSVFEYDEKKATDKKEERRKLIETELISDKVISA